VVNAAIRRQHPNAPLSVEGRRRMVRCVIDRGWTVTVTAGRFLVDAKTVRKWRDRFLAEGDDGFYDRSCRRLRSPNRTPSRLRRQVLELRLKRRWGADHIAVEVGLAASTVQNILSGPVLVVWIVESLTVAPSHPQQRYSSRRIC
jgi:transposase-like protein